MLKIVLDRLSSRVIQTIGLFTRSHPNAQSNGAYPGFSSITDQQGIFSLPPGWDASPARGYPTSIKFAGTYLYIWAGLFESRLTPTQDLKLIEGSILFVIKVILMLMFRDVLDSSSETQGFKGGREGKEALGFRGCFRLVDVKTGGQKV